MAFLIETYYERREAFRSQVAENSLPPDDLVLVQELDYRISILETFQTFCKAAPPYNRHKSSRKSLPTCQFEHL